MTSSGTPVEITFEQALDQTKGDKRDLLLGNGFSIAAHDKFDYRRLLEHADVAADVRAIFASARTSNFEAVMRILLAEMHGADARSATRAREDIQTLKAALIRALHDVHPPRRKEISPERWEQCERFLVHFIGKRRQGRIFTTNYDLLLCWAVTPDRDRIKPQKLFNAFDGFRGREYQGLGAATIIYLHGALHLFPYGSGISQLSYRDTGVALHAQIAERLERGHYPTFVSEGASTLKEPQAPGFLRDALDAFKGTCRAPAKKALFTLGHGLGPEDAHILKWIKSGSIPAVYLGGYGGVEMESFKEIGGGWIAARAEAKKAPLEVFVFNSENVVWGPRALGS